MKPFARIALAWLIGLALLLMAEPHGPSLGTQIEYGVEMQEHAR